MRGRVHRFPRTSTRPLAGSRQYCSPSIWIMQATSRVNSRSLGGRFMAVAPAFRGPDRSSGRRSRAPRALREGTQAGGEEAVTEPWAILPRCSLDAAAHAVHVVTERLRGVLEGLGEGREDVDRVDD